MADEEKTEQATPKKRKEAREEGRVAKSIELNTAFLLLTSVIFFYFNTNSLYKKLSNTFVYFINLSSHFEINTATFPILVKDITYIMFSILGPFLIIILAASLLINIAQIGFMVTPKAIEFKLDKLNPVNGIKNMFSVRSFGESIKSALKASVMWYILYIFIKHNVSSWLNLTDVSVLVIAEQILKGIFSITVYIMIFIVLIAIIDYLFQRYNFEKSIRMSIKEIKDEFKQMEGDPLIKSRIKRMQMELSRRRMMEDVKKADVIITNPTHYAVAIKYDESKMNAPEVTAKGTNKIAEKIKEIAKEADIVIVENPPIARLLYKKSKIGETIPEDMYNAIAEILAYVYKLKNYRKNI